MSCLVIHHENHACIRHAGLACALADVDLPARVNFDAIGPNVHGVMDEIVEVHEYAPIRERTVRADLEF